MMLLIDTAIWIDHLRRADVELIRCLDAESVLVHPFVVGEVALGQAKNLSVFVAQMSKLPKATVANAVEVLELIKSGNLGGCGIGYVDVHLLASCLLMPDARLWTRDKRLKMVAERFAVAAEL